MQRDYKGACTCRSRNTEDKRRVKADSVKKRVVPAVPIPFALDCVEEVPIHGEVAGTKPCVNMLFLPLEGCAVDDMTKAEVLPECTESILMKMITPIIDEEPL